MIGRLGFLPSTPGADLRLYSDVSDVSSSTLKLSPRPYSSLFIFFELRKNYLFYFQLELTFDTILYQFQMHSTALRSLYNLRSDPRFGLMPT